MSRLVTPAGPATGDRSPSPGSNTAGTARETRARPLTDELIRTDRRPAPGAPATVPVQSSESGSEPAWPEWARAPQPARLEPQDWRRLLVPVLLLVVAALSGLLAWLWFGNATRDTDASRTASLTITSEPTGAAVLVDGLARGNTPVTLPMDPGTHQVQVGPDRTAWMQIIDLAPGRSSTFHVVQAAPPPARSSVAEGGALEITTEPSGLAVQVDGKPRGVSPVAVTDLAPGMHEVTIVHGGRVVKRAVSVDAGVPTAVLISTVGEGGVSSGWLTVSGPVPLQIRENGTPLGTSDTPRLLLPTGRHELEFANETFGYRELRRVEVVAGRTATVTLPPSSGTLSVNAQPWAEVWIDGARVGETPIGNLSLPIGNHELVVRHPQLGEQRRTVAVRADTPSRVGIDLRQ